MSFFDKHSWARWVFPVGYWTSEAFRSDKDGGTNGTKKKEAEAVTGAADEAETVEFDGALKDGGKVAEAKRKSQSLMKEGDATFAGGALGA